jgi:predicted metal-binding protein
VSKTDKRSVNANWESAILVCRKCSKKLDGGFGPDGKASLAKALRRALGQKKGRKATLGVVEIACMDICPKGAVTLIDMAQPGRWQIVPHGADVDALAEALVPATQSRAEAA